MSINGEGIFYLLCYVIMLIGASYRAGKRFHEKYDLTITRAYLIAMLQFILMTSGGGILLWMLLFSITQKVLLLFWVTVSLAIILFVLLKKVKPSVYWDRGIWFSKEFND